MLVLASTIVSALEPGPALPFQDAQGDDGPSLADLVDSFIDVREHEVTALLAALAALVSDDVLRQHIRRELDRREGPLPAGLDPLEPLSIDRTVAATHVLGHVDTLVVGVRNAGGQPLTIVVTVDHELGTLVADGFAYPGPPEAAVTRLADDDDPDVTVTDVNPADVRVRITEAIETGRITYPPGRVRHLAGVPAPGRVGAACTARGWQRTCPTRARRARDAGDRSQVRRIHPRSAAR